MGWLIFIFKVKLTFKVKNLPHFELVRAITHHPFKQGPPNLDQSCINTYCFGGWLSLTCQIKLIFKILFICIAFASLKYLWDLQKRMKAESVPHPKWLCTNMFAHTVMSRTVVQSSCIFNATIAGFPVLDSAIGDRFLKAFAKLYIPHIPKFCMPTFCNGRNNSKTACIFLYRVRRFQHELGNPVLFLAQC